MLAFRVFVVLIKLRKCHRLTRIYYNTLSSHNMTQRCIFSLASDRFALLNKAKTGQRQVQININSRDPARR